MRYYVTATRGGKHHLVRPEDHQADRLYAYALCPAAVRSIDVLRSDLPRVPGGLREAADWRRVYGEALCEHCWRMAACEGEAAHA